MVDKVVISAHPHGVATRLPSFKTETPDQFTARQNHHTAAILGQRILVRFAG